MNEINKYELYQQIWTNSIYLNEWNKFGIHNVLSKVSSINNILKSIWQRCEWLSDWLTDKEVNGEDLYYWILGIVGDLAQGVVDLSLDLSQTHGRSYWVSQKYIFS